LGLIRLALWWGFFFCENSLTHILVGVEYKHTNKEGGNMSKTKSEEEKEQKRVAYIKKSTKLAAIICPLATARYECDFEWNYIQKAFKNWEDDYGGFELDPDFQRGHVWTPEQQQHFIENCLRGVVSSSGFVIQLNCPNWDNENVKSDLPKGFQCIDGLQRLTAVFKFLSSEVKPFGLTPKDLEFSSFMIKSAFRFRVAVHTFTKKVDLLGHYLDLNTGGTPHSKEEIERVKMLKEGLK
jgi:hypothetical protein